MATNFNYCPYCGSPLRTFKGWANGSTLAEGAQVIEKYYGNDILNMTIALYENYEDELIEDGYFEGFGSDQEDI